MNATTRNLIITALVAFGLGFLGGCAWLGARNADPVRMAGYSALHENIDVLETWALIGIQAAENEQTAEALDVAPLGPTLAASLRDRIPYMRTIVDDLIARETGAVDPDSPLPPAPQPVLPPPDPERPN